jgi:hypothetical protein
MKITIQPAEVDDRPRIAVKNNAYDAAFPSRMKQIAGSRWAPDLKCWHIPHTKEAWTALKSLFPDCEITAEAAKLSVLPPQEKQQAKPAPTLPPLPFLLAPPDQLIVRFASNTPDRFFVSVDRNRTDWVAMIKGIEGRAWHSDVKH